MTALTGTKEAPDPASQASASALPDAALVRHGRWRGVAGLAGNSRAAELLEAAPASGGGRQQGPPRLASPNHWSRCARKPRKACTAVPQLLPAACRKRHLAAKSGPERWCAGCWTPPQRNAGSLGSAAAAASGGASTQLVNYLPTKSPAPSKHDTPHRLLGVMLRNQSEGWPGCYWVP